MAPEPSSVEQAVSRTLRDNLEKLQRMAEELHQAIADLVSACGSSRPSNALPPMVRAQTAAASLAASLDVLSRLVTAAIQSVPRAAGEEEIVRVVGVQPPQPLPEPTPPLPSTPTPMGQAPAADIPPPEPVSFPQSANIMEFSVPPQMFSASPESAGGFAEAGALELDTVADQMAAFDLLSLPAEEQDLHRRANRVAKVSMQDIQMLRPEQVNLGRERKDICARLRDDIEKARKEYDRRFGSILGHPVDYFYHWMVEILGGGDPEMLGEYPYPTPVLRR